MTHTATSPATTPAGPHRALASDSERERFTAELFDRLWDRYRERVSYVAVYERLLQQAGATFFNDHIAFRTFACQNPTTGIVSIARIFEALGYRAAGCYQFPDKHLNAIHYQHPNAQFPKLFVSELRTWDLPLGVRDRILKTTTKHREPLPDETLAALAGLDAHPPANRAALLEGVLEEFQRLPWEIPEKEDVLAVAEESQYAAWMLVHGYEVNHFTAQINSHGVAALDDIEKTIAALAQAGVPMKKTIEGEGGSKLRQSATEAVVIDVAVREHGRETAMPWTYAYFELAERGEIPDPETGKLVRFEGFLGPQATNLFEMTRVKA